MEKKGRRKVSNEMLSFSDWINSHSLLDLQLCGASYTWSNHQDPPIMSRLDRFLIANDWLDLYPDVNQVALPKPASDHSAQSCLTQNVRDGVQPHSGLSSCGYSKRAFRN